MPDRRRHEPGSESLPEFMRFGGQDAPRAEAELRTESVIRP